MSKDDYITKMDSVNYIVKCLQSSHRSDDKDFSFLGYDAVLIRKSLL